MKKLITSQTFLMGLFMFAVMLAWVSVATAVNIGNGLSGDLGKPVVIIEPYYDAGGGSTIDIGSEKDPIGIYLDPTAGPWKKNFIGVGGGLLTINEWVRIAAAPNTIPPGPPWTDWDELILDAGWIWTGAPTVSLSDDGNVAGVISTKFNQNDFVVFNFPAENPGAMLHVVKTLMWNGGAQVPTTVTVEQWPTPEPGTLALLLSGGVALAAVAWRRRR